MDTSEFDIPAFAEAMTGAAMMHALLNQATVGDSVRTDRARESMRSQVDQALAIIGLRRK
ncbi:hypothetical protein [Nocardia sp. alder85J]|uniref:hypothetical protein n=1 Tax=Nocardia sp. alder85J TaxID=2862949 RepID=UPI001CD349F8|nr:hypothetical protein [Nocardia sp. alder85J]MCX4098606.1 hypothetical protein [Nocardia sp. alder85J]